MAQLRLSPVGYDDVAVLDGGLTKWNAETRPLELGQVEPRPAAGFTAVPRPELWVDKAFVESVVAGNTDAALVCSLPPAEFAGVTGARPRLGHIPGSISLPAGQLVDRGTNASLVDADLEKRVAPAGSADSQSSPTAVAALPLTVPAA